MIKVTVKLEPQERDALWELSQRERRDMRDQAALIIRRELERAGLLPADQPTPINVAAQAVQHVQG